MKKQKNRLTAHFRKARILPILAVAAIIAVGATSVQIARAASLQQQINSLNQQNSQTQSTVSGLQLQATSYQNAISKLNAQIYSTEKIIHTNEAKQAAIQLEVNVDQVRLTQEKQVLGEDIKSMYVNGSMSTVEMLATSQNLSSFVDAETYRGAVQTKIQGTLTQISNLENQLDNKKNQVDELLNSEQGQQTQLSNDQSQQSSLLAMDQSQQTAYTKQIKNNNAQIQQLQIKEAAQLAALGGNTYYGGTGSYPWADAPCMAGPGSGSTCGDYDWGYPTGPVPLGAPVGAFDPWGYQYRNCTSYVAWKIDSISTSPVIGNLISGLGNAAQWPSNVPQSWISSTPQANDAAVVPGVADGQGHVMFVQSVNSNGTINVSQYNVVPGEYSAVDGSSTDGLIFIHFPGT